MLHVLLAAVVIGAFGVVPEAHAQASMYMVYTDWHACPPVDFIACKGTKLMRATVDGPRSRIDWQRDVPILWDIKEGYVTPDARHVVWLGISLTTGPSVYVHDVDSGRTNTFGPFHGAVQLLGNPAKAEIYLFDHIGATALSADGARRIALPCAPVFWNQPPEISRDGRRASYECMELRTVVFDTETRAVVSVVPEVGTISPDGQDVITRTFSNGGPRVRRWSLAEGRVLADVPRSFVYFSLDRVSDAVIEWNRGSFEDNVRVLDAKSLATTGSARLDIASTSNHGGPVFDSVNKLIAAFSYGIDVVDVRAQRRIGRLEMTADYTAAIAFAPPAPTSPLLQAAVVSSGTVQLGWQFGGPAASVSRYVLDVGSAPGLSNIFSGRDIGLQTTFSASGVPPGRYYVRVRAGNYTGLSAPSNDVAVVVP